MQNRAASNASSRWGADAATTTEVSPIASGPVRCSRASRPVEGQRRRASSAICREPGHDLLLIRLVFELPHGFSTLGVVARGAREHHDCAAIGPHRPVVHDTSRQHVVGQQQPGVALVGRFEHTVMLGGTVRTPLGRGYGARGRGHRGEARR